MQADQPTFKLYPKFDSTKGKDPFLNSEEVQIMSNYYGIMLRKDYKTIFQYSIGFEPELPADASKLAEKLVESVKRELRTKLGFICFKGRMLWGNVNQELAMITKAAIDVKGEKQQYEVILKPAGKLTIEDFILKDEANSTKLTQILNINIKNSLKNIGYKELDKGRYYSEEEFGANVIKEAGLSVWRGYQVTVAPIASNLYLKVDVCSRVLKTESFLDTLKKTNNINDKLYINNTFKGSSIITRYGTHRLLRIEEIDYSVSPKSLFQNDKEQKSQSYIDYYKSVYKTTIKEPNQPLIKVIVNNCEKKQVQYFVPELVCLTGLTEEQRNDYQVMSSLATWTKLRVDQRVKETNKIVDQLSKGAAKDLMFDIQPKAREFSAVVANSPGIELGKRKIIQPNRGEMALRDQLLDPINLKDYFFVYTSRAAWDDDDADATYDMLNKASRAYGIRLNKPVWINIKCAKNERLTAKDWINQIDAEVQKGKPEFVILYFNNDEKKDKKLYEGLKSHLIHKLQLNSQVITKKTLSANAKGGMSKASKILLQINDKMGHPLYKVQKQHPFWSKNTIAIGSLASSGGPKGIIASFVGTRTNDLTQHYSDFNKIEAKQNIPEAVLSTFISSWLKEYYKTEGKKLPDVLILYREGLNEKQASKVLQEELKIMTKVFQNVAQKANKAGWKPKLIYLLVSQKTGTRAYDIDKSRRLSNPLPGTIIGSDMSKNGEYEFLMASALTTQGTCNMVQYKVAYDSSNQSVPHQALKILTYEQCYNYPNWAGSIRFPAPLQKANKLAKFVSTQGETHIDKSNVLKVVDYYI